MTTQKPTLFGYGMTTKAIARHLGGGCIFFDDRTEETYTDEDNNTIHPSSEFDPSQSALEVTTPSLKPDHPLIDKAHHLLSEYDYFASRMPFSIWISGTNGKTTTTQMLTHILGKRGAISGGNIGTPLADLDPKAPIWVLETSSFTLHHTHIASPNIYLLLPITPDHLDWHGSSQAYTADKLRPLLTMKEGELALIPKGLPIPPTHAYVVEYDSNEMLATYFDIDSTKLTFKGAFLQDALLALAVTKVLFDEIDYTRMNNFQLDAHRQEKVLDAKKRVWINDSKATNLDATVQAIKTFSDKPLHLILGGDDKGVDLTPLFELMQTLQITLYTIGANNDKLLTLAQEYGIDAIESKTVEAAVAHIDPHHTQQSIAMLSPAAASLDQFSSYKARGDHYKNLIYGLKS